MLSTLFRISSILLICTSVMANDIYIIQSGDNLDLDVTQDGQNNQIEGLGGIGTIHLSLIHISEPTRPY